MQGFDFVGDGLASAAGKMKLSQNKLGHMLGNATSLSVTERVLLRVLMSLGFVDENHLDRWRDAVVGPLAMA